ncbi:hypothetical protein ACWEFL_15885 [Streptomyces sp. NPDC004838]
MARVRVPWRLVTSSHYSHAAVSVYVKIGGLAQRDGWSEAGVAYLAVLLGLSRSAVERSLTQLMRPAPDDDVIELVSHRRTYDGGRGRTAKRRIRRTDRREPGAWVPTRAPEALTPVQLRTYAALSYAVDRRIPVSHRDLGMILRHRTGRQAGRPLGERAVGRIIQSLADLGWITVHHRAGLRGMNTYEVHEEPVQPPLPTPDPAPVPASEDGSGGDHDDGSLATEEDRSLDSPDEPPPAGGSIRRRRNNRSYGPEPVENPAARRGPAALRPAYTGPPLTITPRIHHVLQPVQHLLGALPTHPARTLALKIGAQLDHGTPAERLRQRLQRHYRDTEPIRDLAGWLLGPALDPGGCNLDACEAGVIWHTGERCHCADTHAQQRPDPPPPTRHPPPTPAPRPPRPASWCPCPDHP